ncbi:MAG: biotin/lipoyl-binding protein [Cyanobacteria bacterium P01_D01_bin.73]
MSSESDRSVVPMDADDAVPLKKGGGNGASSPETDAAIAPVPQGLAPNLDPKEAQPIDPSQSQVAGEDLTVTETSAEPRRTFVNPRGSGLKFGPLIGMGMVAIAGFVGWKVYDRLNQSAVEPVAEEEAPQQPTRRLAVRVVTAQRGLAEQWLFDEGVVWPVNRRVLNFQADGDITYVANINGVPLREGDRVTRGQLLATIDSRRQASQITTANADIQVAVNQRRQAQSNRLKAQTSITKAESDLELARSELRRNQELFSQGVIAENEIDVKRNQVDQAQAALASAKQDLRTSLEEVKSADSQVTAARARLSQEAVDFEDTRLVAPISGVVAYINIRQGEYWSTRYLDTSSVQRVTETAPIVLMDANSFEAVLEVQSIAAEAIRPGQRVYAVLEDEVSSAQAAGVQQAGLLKLAQKRGSIGRIFSVSPSQSPGDRGTRVSIRGFQRPERLKVGGRVYAWVSTASKPGAVMVPLGSLIVRDQDHFAFVLKDDGTVERREVQLGIEGLSGVEVLSGINAGDQVVIEGQNRLVTGTPVEVIERDAASQGGR